MMASQPTVEQKLAEFTEVHGTVLLGMHRELQSQLKRVDEKLAAAGSSLQVGADDLRAELSAKVADARESIERQSQAVTERVEQAHAAFTRQVAAAEGRVVAYMVAQQKLLDQHASRLEAMHAETQKLLTNTNAKIEAHQIREAALNRRLRYLLLTVAVTALIFVAVGASRLWMN